MNSVSSKNLSLKYQRSTLLRLNSDRDYKIRVCGKDSIPLYIYLNIYVSLYLADMTAVTTGPKRTRQTYTRYQTLELEKVKILIYRNTFLQFSI